jgi:hypothetical protein
VASDDEAGAGSDACPSRAGTLMPVWAWVLIIVLLILLVFGGIRLR